MKKKYAILQHQIWMILDTLLSLFTYIARIDCIKHKGFSVPRPKIRKCYLIKTFYSGPAKISKEINLLL